MWYNNKAVAKSGNESDRKIVRSLKIEQQWEKYKAYKYVQEQISQFLENTTQTKSKEQSSSKKDIKHRKMFHIPFFESLILAQDERWRRA